MKKIIWFNHWFSTAYHFINQVKQLNDVLVIGTNKRKECAYAEVCDEFYVEPDIVNYVDWCIDFCKEHNVSVFLPRKAQDEISKHIDEFENIGVKVIVERNSLVTSLGNKILTNSLFKNLRLGYLAGEEIVKIPEIRVATNCEEFLDAYNELKTMFPKERICFKYAVDEGATSFRVIDDAVDTIDSLRKGIGHKISLEKALAMFKSVKTFDPVILMIFLNGTEISIDSLKTSKGFVGCARYKKGTRGSIIDANSKYIEISKRMAECLSLSCPYNLQIKMHDGHAYLLEVNTRMAGGTYKCSSAGINFAYLVVADALGLEFNLPEPTGKILVSHIEKPVVVKDY